MRYVILALIVSGLGSHAAADATHDELVAQIEEHRAVDAVPTPQLAAEILALSYKHNVDPRLLAAMVLQESRGREKAYNPKSGDHGIAQINTRTAIQLKLSVQCLYNWRCNLRAAAALFAKNRPCLYNLGENRVLTGKFITLCHAYEQKLATLY